MAMVFIMLTVLVQVSLAMTARSSADAAVTAAAHRAALPGADGPAETAGLATAIGRLVPAATQVRADVVITADRAVARASFAWFPPGPSLFPITITVSAEVPRATPP